jgi:hypothetical protein
MDKNNLLKRVKEEEDYVRCPKCSNSLAKFLAKNSEGADDATIARLLMTTEDRVKEIYEEAVKRLRKGMEDES